MYGTNFKVELHDQYFFILKGSEEISKSYATEQLKIKTMRATNLQIEFSSQLSELKY